MKASTLVFDLDGTLSNPASGIVNCVNYALEQCGYAPRSADEISAEIGPPLDLMFSKFLPDVTEQQMNQLVAAYRERFVVTGFAENFLYQGIDAAIQSLHAEGFRLGVCTSKPEKAARKVLQHFDLLQYFNFVSGGDIGIAKQSQLEDLLNHKLIDKDAVMIGDRGVDLIAGNNNGLRTVGVLWGFGSLEELNAESPITILRQIDELLTNFTPIAKVDSTPV